MSEIKKSVDGLLFYEDFSDPSSLMWTLSPSYMTEVLEFGAKGPVVTEKGLRIRHSGKYITYTINEPVDTDEYACIVDLHHVPISFEDIGGVIVLSNNNHYAECQTYLATGSSEVGNSKYFYQDIQEMIDVTLDNKYVTYKFDDINIDDHGDTPGEIVDPSENPENYNPFSPGPYKDKVYRYIKFYKIRYKYFFYASTDGFTWINVGSVAFEQSSVIGLFLYGYEEDSNLVRDGFFKCNTFAIYSSKYINIHGIDTLKEFELSSNGKILLRTDNTEFLLLGSRSNKTTLINTTSLPMPIENAHIRVYDKEDYSMTYAEYDLGTVYGGDEFIITTDLRVFIDNSDVRTEVKTNQMFDLGSFYHGSNYIKMYIHNYDTEPADNITLQVNRYSIYYGGEEEVKIALYEDNLPMHSLSFYKKIKIERIQPSEGVTVYIKLTERPVQDYFMTANEYRFKIIME